jgi:hypothetical protein
VAALRREDDPGRHDLELASQLVLNQELLPGVIGFLDLEAGGRGRRSTSFAAVLGAGLTFELTDDLVLEPAAHFGLSRSAPDPVFSLTLVMRF